MPRIKTELKKHDRDDAARDSVIFRQVVRARVRINEVYALLQELFNRMGEIMAAIDDLRAANTRAQTAIDGISTDLQTLKDLLANAGSGGLNAADTAEALTMATALADRLNTIDIAYPPTPPTP